MPTEKQKKVRIKKGQVLNPKGRPKTSKAMKEMRKLTRAHFEKVANEYLFMDVNELKDLVSTKGSNFKDMNCLEGMVATAIAECMRYGRVQVLMFFLERLITKARTEHEPRSIPTAKEMVTETMRAATIELSRLQYKAKYDGLDAEETRSLMQLSKVTSEMIAQAEKLDAGNDPRSLSDQELMKEAKKAMKVVADNVKSETKH